MVCPSKGNIFVFRKSFKKSFACLCKLITFLLKTLMKTQVLKAIKTECIDYSCTTVQRPLTVHITRLLNLELCMPIRPLQISLCNMNNCKIFMN